MLILLYNEMLVSCYHLPLKDLCDDPISYLQKVYGLILPGCVFVYHIRTDVGVTYI